jgi:hypothetical protein
MGAYQKYHTKPSYSSYIRRPLLIPRTSYTFEKKKKGYTHSISF